MTPVASTWEAEESQIVGHWLEHVARCLGKEGEDGFRRALRDARITPEDVRRHRNLRHAHLDAVMRAVRKDVPDITLKVMSVLRLLDLGLVGYAAASSESVGKAIEVVHSYHELTSDRYYEVLEIEGDAVIVRPLPRLQFSADLQDIAEDAVAGVWALLRQLVGPDAAIEWDRAEACFPYSAPGYVATYRSVFQCPCRFGAERIELRFPKAWLKLPVATANSATADLCSAMCERILGPGRSAEDTVQTVSRLLISRPGRRVLRLEEAAAALNLSTAQLRKRLYRAGTSYKQVVLQVRMTLARHYVEATHLPIQSVAYLLDYAQPAPFSRAFKRYFGLSPQTCRQGAHSVAANV
jgi:AraC-like DNA-binding protein